MRMNNGQLRSALTILKYLLRAPESDKAFIFGKLSDEEIKAICKLASVALSRNLKRSPKDKALIAKNKEVVLTLGRARTRQDYKKARTTIKRAGGGIISSILLSLLGGAITAAIAPKK
jgi:hypothetical protein